MKALLISIIALLFASCASSINYNGYEYTSTEATNLLNQQKHRYLKAERDIKNLRSKYHSLNTEIRDANIRNNNLTIENNKLSAKVNSLEYVGVQWSDSVNVLLDSINSYQLVMDSINKTKPQYLDALSDSSKVVDKYESGEVRSISPYKNGKMHGTRYVYYKDGTVELKIPYKNDKPHGTAYFYYKDGTVERKTPYKNGKMHETQYVYYKDGTVKRKTPYKNGKIQGTEYRYYENGTVEWKTPYKNGKIQGTEYRYNEDGSLSWKVPYVNGKIGSRIVTRYIKSYQTGVPNYTKEWKSYMSGENCKSFYKHINGRWILNYEGLPQNDIRRCSDHHK